MKLKALCKTMERKEDKVKGKTRKANLKQNCTASLNTGTHDTRGRAEEGGKRQALTRHVKKTMPRHKKAVNA